MGAYVLVQAYFILFRLIVEKLRYKYFKSINSTLPGRSMTSIDTFIRRIIVVESIFITDLNYCQGRFSTRSLKRMK